MTIAQQVYDFIDKHIQHLDQDLRMLNQEIETDKNRVGLKEDQTACGVLGIELKKGLRKAKSQAGDMDAGGSKGQGKRKGKKKDVEDLEDDAGAMLGAPLHLHACTHALMHTLLYLTIHPCSLLPPHSHAQHINIIMHSMADRACGRGA